jgi:hypothetical protein
MKRVRAKSKAKRPLKLRVENKYILETDEVVGQCWPWSKPRAYTIEIDPRQCPKDYMDTLIHEALHEILPKKKEKFILNAGTTIANLLWRLGYRRLPKHK